VNQITPESVRAALYETWGQQACQIDPTAWPAMFRRLTAPPKEKGASRAQIREAITTLVEEYSAHRLDPEAIPGRLRQLTEREERRGNLGARFESAVAALSEAYAAGPPDDGASVIFLHFPMLDHVHRVALDRRLAALSRKAAWSNEP
jgi:hypothetical protein